MAVDCGKQGGRCRLSTAGVVCILSWIAITYAAQPHIWIEGLPARINISEEVNVTCIVTMVTPQNASTIWWQLDDDVISSTQLKQPDTNVSDQDFMDRRWNVSMTYVIKRSHHGRHLVCAARTMNGTEWARATVEIHVNYPYTTKVTTSGEPVNGGNISITCDTVEEGNPAIVLQYLWKHNGFDILPSGGATGPMISFSSLDFRLEGDFTCLIQNEAGWGATSRPYSLKLLYAPEGQPSVNPGGDGLLARRNRTFTCDVTNMPRPGNPTPSRAVWVKMVAGKQVVMNETGLALTVEGWNQTGIYVCAVSNRFGQSNRSQLLHFTSNVPSIFEEPLRKTYMSASTNESTVQLSVVFSTSHVITKITWYKDGEDVPPSGASFSMPDGYTMTGQFQLDRTEAYHEILNVHLQQEWRSCESVAAVAGVYTCCISTSHPLFPDDLTCSQPIILNIPHKPMWKGASSSLTLTEGVLYQPIRCDVCVYPEAQYRWLLNGAAVPGMVHMSGDTLIVDEVSLGYTGTYTCMVHTVQPDGQTHAAKFAIPVTVQEVSGSPLLTLVPAITGAVGGFLLLLCLVLTGCALQRGMKKEKERRKRNDQRRLTSAEEPNKSQNVYTNPAFVPAENEYQDIRDEPLPMGESIAIHNNSTAPRHHPMYSSTLPEPLPQDGTRGESDTDDYLKPIPLPQESDNIIQNESDVASHAGNSAEARTSERAHANAGIQRNRKKLKRR